MQKTAGFKDRDKDYSKLNQFGFKEDCKKSDKKLENLEVHMYIRRDLLLYCHFFISR